MRLLAAVALAGAVGSVAPAHAAGCFTFTDPSGDTEIVLANVADAEPDLDIVGVEYLTTATHVGARIEVARLATTPLKAPGDVFQVGFTHDGFYFDLFAERLAGNVVRPGSTPAGLTVVASFDPATTSVTITAPLADLRAATGSAATRLEDLNAGTSADYGTWVLYDEAFPLSPSATYAVGSACH